MEFFSHSLKGILKPVEKRYHSVHHIYRLFSAVAVAAVLVSGGAAVAQTTNPGTTQPGTEIQPAPPPPAATPSAAAPMASPPPAVAPLETPRAAATPETSAATPAAAPKTSATTPKPTVHHAAKASATPKHTGISHTFRHVGRKLEKFFTGHQTIEE